MPTPEPYRHTPGPLLTCSSLAPAIEIRDSHDVLLVRVDLITREVWVKDEAELDSASQVFWTYLRAKVAA